MQAAESAFCGAFFRHFTHYFQHGSHGSCSEKPLNPCNNCPCPVLLLILTASTARAYCMHTTTGFGRKEKNDAGYDGFQKRVCITVPQRA
jgi:hypothetical protein